MKVYERKYSDKQLRDWLLENYSSRYSEIWNDSSTNDLVAESLKKGAALAQDAESETDEAKKRSLSHQSLEFLFNAAILNTKQSNAVSLAVFGMVFNQLLNANITPAIPVEFYEYLDGMCWSSKRTDG